MILVRWILGLILTLAIVLALAVVFLPSWFNPNDYRHDLEIQMGKVTGRDIALEGDLQLSVFPWLGVRTQALTISQPAAIGGDFVQIETAELRLKLLPLFSQRVEIDTVLVDGARVHFIKVNDELNSLFVEAPASAESREQAEPSLLDAPSDAGTADAAGQNFNTTDVVLQGVSIRNATLLYEDRSTGSGEAQITQVNDFNGTLGRVEAGTFAAFALQGILANSAEGVANERDEPMMFAVDGEVAFTPASELDGLSKGSALNARDVTVTLNTTEQQITAELAQATLKDMQQLEVLDTQLVLNAEWLAQPLQLDVPTLSYQLEKDELKVKAASLVLANSRAQISSLAVAKLIENPSYTFKLDMPSHSLAQTLDALDFDYQANNPRALQSVAAQAEVSGGNDRVNVTQGVINLDATKASFGGQVRNFADPVIDLKLDLDTIDLDDYLPRSEESREAEAGQSLAASLAVPMAAFEGFMADALLSAQSVTSGGVQLTDVRVAVKSDKAKVVITPTANLYEGKLLGDIAYGEEAGVPTLRINNEIDLVSLGELLTSADITDQLTGLGSLVVDLIITERNGKQYNEGTIKLFAKNGALKGVDVKQVLDTTYAQYQSLRRKLKDEEPAPANTSAQSQAAGQPTAESAQGTASPAGLEDLLRPLPEQPVEGVGQAQDATGFAELLGTFNVKDFRITNTDFSLKAPLFRISGAGDIDLASEQLDYTVNIAVVNSTAGQGGDALEKLKGITLPVRFSGALLAPRFSVDTKMLYRSLLKQELDEKKGEYLQDNLGIEGAENLSTKETLKQALLEKLLNPDRDKERDPSENTRERPMQERTPENDTQSPSTPAEPQNTDPAAAQPLDKDALKQELGKKLLDEIFK